MQNRIEVTFGVDLPLEQIAEIKKRLDELHPGTIAYCNVWDELSSLHKAFLVRLEGECGAYMNIAKTATKEAFFGISANT